MALLLEKMATLKQMDQTVSTKIKSMFLTKLVLMCLTMLGVDITLVYLHMDKQGQAKVIL